METMLSNKQVLEELGKPLFAAVIMIFLWGMILGGHHSLVTPPKIVRVPLQVCKLLPPPVLKINKRK